MNRIVIFALIAFYSIFSSCSSKQKPVKLSVKWEVISNTSFDKPIVKAAFTLYNNSNITLTSNNWALYFSQAPRGIIKDSTKQLASIVSLGGDYFKLSPNDGFVLKPGDSLKVEYLADAWYIKESDAPAGIYFIVNDSIILADNYSIVPFTRPEQINRFIYDKEPIPTPQWQFAENEKLTLLPAIDLLPILPQPEKMILGKDSVSINSECYILSNPDLKNESSFLKSRLKQLMGVDIGVSENIIPGKFAIILKLSNENKFAGNAEAYELKTGKSSVEITAIAPAGVYYGIQSLLMLFPAKSYSKPISEITIPQITVNDSPRYSYRGMHIDVSRNFQTKAEILRIIDVMAMYKLNTLHFYITEDEGWRIEIKSLPELTEIGSKRGHTKTETDMLNPAYGSGPFSDPGLSHGSGFYSQDDFKEIIKYAHNNHISVIPSINFPGHARAAIKSMEVRYQRLMGQGKQTEANEFRLIDPDDKSEYRSVQGYNDNVVDVALESTYHFFETVIDEVIAMYAAAGVPLETIHTGGDEVPEGVWAKSPSCEKLMSELKNITDAKNLQNYFLKRINIILTSKNLKTAGWEEVALKKDLNGKYIVNPEFADKNVIPYVWNNLNGAQDLAYRLANAGYPIVFCGVSNFYFDLAYNKDPQEPGLYWGGFVDERKPWDLAPENLFISTSRNDMGEPINADKDFVNMARLEKKSTKKIIGLQAQLFAETIQGSEMLEHLLLPKLISFAERAWAPEPQWQNISDTKTRNQNADVEWNIFINSLVNKELEKLTYFNGGYNFRVPAPGAVIENGILKANTQYPGAEIFFTTDGTEPNEHSDKYTGPINISGQVKLLTIAPGGKKSRVIILN